MQSVSKDSAPAIPAKRETEDNANDAKKPRSSGNSVEAL